MIQKLTKFSSRHLWQRAKSFSSITTTDNLVQVNVDEKNGYSTVLLNRPPVNGLNLELNEVLTKTLDDLAKDNCRGVILTSTSKSVFCAGMELSEMYKPESVRFRKFWTSFQDLWIRLYSVPYPIVNAINGHSIAGGCVLSSSCDHRVMMNNFKIGLNETQIGLVVPPLVELTAQNLLGFYKAEQILTQGTVFTTEEAYKIGLIDDVAESIEELFEKCINWLDQFKKVSYRARAETKTILRGRTIEKFKKMKDDDLNLMEKVLNRPDAQETLENGLKKLKNK